MTNRLVQCTTACCLELRYDVGVRDLCAALPFVALTKVKSAIKSTCDSPLK